MRRGNCHEAASRLQARMARDGKDAVLVQATVLMPTGRRDWHSWCEYDGMVYDNSNGARLENGGTWSPGRGVPGGVRGGRMLVESVESYYGRREVGDVRRYTQNETFRHLIRTDAYCVFEP
jgi:hypothetical protein